MFEFLFQKTSGQKESLIDIITADIKKIELSKLAIEKAVSIIASAIAKSEIKLYNDDGTERINNLHYKLNVCPNDNQLAYDFWFKVVKKLLTEQDCVIFPLNDNYYIADSYSVNDVLLKPKTYSGITISDANATVRINKNYKSTDLIHLKYHNTKIKAYLTALMNNYEGVLSALSSGVKNKSGSKFKMSVNGQVTLIEKQTDGTDKRITADEFKKKLAKLLNDDELQILTLPNGIDLQQIKSEASAEVSSMTALAKEIFTTTAMAFDIPQAVFFGTITEKSDASNELITYAVSPVAKIIDDGLNNAIVGAEYYIKGELIKVDLSKFKHFDIIDCASGLDKLRAIGWTLDEIFDIVGRRKLNTEFSTKRALTKNYADEEEI